MQNTSETRTQPRGSNSFGRLHGFNPARATYTNSSIPKIGWQIRTAAQWGSDGLIACWKSNFLINRAWESYKQSSIGKSQILEFAVIIPSLHQPPTWRVSGQRGMSLIAVIYLSLLHISEPTRRTPISFTMIAPLVESDFFARNWVSLSYHKEVQRTRLHCRCLIIAPSEQ